MDDQLAPATAPTSSIQEQKIINAPVATKKLTQNRVNLYILLLISLFLLLDVLAKNQGYAIDTIRMFGNADIGSDFLQKLLPLRIGIAFVFFWYAIDNFTHPQIFNNLANVVLKKMHLEKNKINLSGIGYIQSICEFFVAVSFMTGTFLDLGGLGGSLLLFAVLFAYEEGLGSLIIRDLGLLGATLTTFLLTIK